MITPEKAQADYELAMATFRELAVAPGLSAEERLAVRDGMREVTARYLDQLELEIHALTAQYQDFIDTMTALIAELQIGNTPLSALNKLKGIVEGGTALLKAATEPVPRPAGARGKSRSTVRASREVAGEGVLRILCVHGVGHQENDPTFETVWSEAITAGLSYWNTSWPFAIEFVAYDDLFAADPPSAIDVAKAVVKMGASGLVHGVGDLFRRQRGLGDIAETARWTAGMVVQWAENNKLRAQARARVQEHMERFQPHAVLGHSLGSLLCYDLFARNEGKSLLRDRAFVSFGSQIGNPFVRSTLGGRIEPLAAARWFHLFNPHDDAFTASLRIPSPAFEQVDASFDVEGLLDHDAGEYLRHRNTVNIVWRSLALPLNRPKTFGPGVSDSAVMLTAQASSVRPVMVTKPTRRALLVGINDYPNEADRLEGCVNDVFLMSSLLQECGFDADNIRVVLNERATAAGILERLEWLLDGTEDEQDRVFYYSGHGAQIPGYGLGETVDHKDECLVTYDFNWTREHAVTDDQFHDLYSQLPYNTRFLTIFDCCHSGGLTRDGAARVRGLTPPDDIRHRQLRWDAKHEMWVPRELPGVYDDADEKMKRPELFGEGGAVNRIGRANELRQDKKAFEEARKAYGHKGPFMPIILQACQEKEFAFEYRHGVQSYGAFTYSLALIMRTTMRKKAKVSWEDLINQTAKKLADLHYDQKPCLVAPTALRAQPVPWRPAS